ncbi:MAG TPA: TIGR02391 family protein [Patescibacteria group bacterium]|nr:TIGR02391 family protein [Patescibacteria group bacterium]
MSAIKKFDDNSLEAICKILADTADGLTGSEIESLLRSSSIHDITPQLTKWKRLFNALHVQQQKDGCSNNVITFIQHSMDPIRYARMPEKFHSRQVQLNIILALRGYEITQSGKVQYARKVETLSEAERRARSLRLKLIERGTHPDVLGFCKAELLEENYFHAVFEATKSVAEKLRSLTGLTDDGADLVDDSLAVKRPMLIINNLSTETEQSEQKGFMNLLKGIFGVFRNTTAHEPKIKWVISEQDALYLLAMASYVHRKLDSASRTGLSAPDTGKK